MTNDREAFSLVELRATVHHLGDIVAAGAGESSSDGGSSDSGMGDFSGYGAHAQGHGGGGRAGGGWNGSEDDSGGWGVEYTWSAQGGVGRHQAPTLVRRMPQAICTNYLRVRQRGNSGANCRCRSGLDFFDVHGRSVEKLSPRCVISLKRLAGLHAHCASSFWGTVVVCGINCTRL